MLSYQQSYDCFLSCNRIFHLKICLSVPLFCTLLIEFCQSHLICLLSAIGSKFNVNSHSSTSLKT